MYARRNQHLFCSLSFRFGRVRTCVCVLPHCFHFLAKSVQGRLTFTSRQVAPLSFTCVHSFFKFFHYYLHCRKLKRLFNYSDTFLVGISVHFAVHFDVCRADCIAIHFIDTCEVNSCSIEKPNFRLKR